MKKSRFEVERRQSQILEWIQSDGRATVAALAKGLGVSLQTIRRDLQCLEDGGRLERFYGGARPGGELQRENGEVCREAIARYAASLVEDGDSIFINTSSTALGMIPYITSQGVTVITNNGNVIHTPRPQGVTIVLTGGELRCMKGAMVGDFAIGSLSKVTAKKSFVGCSGISIDSGMTTEIVNEVNLNEMMLHRVTDESYILADHAKLGKRSSFVSCPIESVRNIITDWQAPQKVVEEFRQKGIRIYQAR